MMDRLPERFEREVLGPVGISWISDMNPNYIHEDSDKGVLQMSRPRDCQVFFKAEYIFAAFRNSGIDYDFDKFLEELRRVSLDDYKAALKDQEKRIMERAKAKSDLEGIIRARSKSSGFLGSDPIPGLHELYSL